jgi:hypothetical protein
MITRTSGPFGPLNVLDLLSDSRNYSSAIIDHSFQHLLSYGRASKAREFFVLPTPIFQFETSPRCRRPGQVSCRGFIGRPFLARTIIARYLIEESMEKRQNNLTLYDAAS